MIPIYHLHPIAIHFPIAFLTGGLAAQWAVVAWKGAAPLKLTARALLLAGVVGLWTAVGLGELAERTAPHVPPAWEVLYNHSERAYWTAWTFTAVAALALWLRDRAAAALAIAWTIGIALLMATAVLGGKLVYEFGMGVAGRGL